MPGASTWSQFIHRTELLPGATMSGSVVKLELGSVLKSVAQVPLGPTRRPRICATACSLVGVWGPCCSRGHIDLGSLCCHLGHGVIWAQAVAEDRGWIRGSTAAQVCVDV